LEKQKPRRWDRSEGKTAGHKRNGIACSSTVPSLFQLANPYRNGLSPAEVAFVAESTTISIQPRQAMSNLQLIDVSIIFKE
jgi:hypothetical protein